MLATSSESEIISTIKDLESINALETVHLKQLDSSSVSLEDTPSFENTSLNVQSIPVVSTSMADQEGSVKMPDDSEFIEKADEKIETTLNDLQKEQSTISPLEQS